jgi:hypothetical protein
MKNNIFKDSVLQYIKDNPGKSSFDIKCGASTEPLSEKLTSKFASTLARLVEQNLITRVLINPARPQLGYNYWFNEERISLDNEPTLRNAMTAVQTKAAAKVDFVLNLIETKPGITSSRIRSLFGLSGHGAAASAVSILEKLLKEKLIQRKQIQVGNPTAGYFYWAADAKITQLVAPNPSERVRVNITPKHKPDDPIAAFSSAAPAVAVDTSQSNIEIAIRLCEIEAYRNPKLFREYMACAENIRKVGLTA